MVGHLLKSTVMGCSIRAVVSTLLVALTPLIAFSQESGKPTDEGFFEARVRPVLVEKCGGCHGAKKQEMGLRLDSAAAFRKGSDAGPVVDTDRPDESTLLEVLSHDGPVKMPPDEKLSETALSDLTNWVRLGAPWPETSTDSPTRSAAETHWAFQPVQRPTVPAQAGNGRDPIDAFLMERLKAQGLSFAPEADRRSLIRRLSFDLTGLPPTADEVNAFVNDNRPGDLAYARLVDRLLASPRYGERWGRHWLDVARYADTKGYVFLEDGRYPWAYAYRDYVIESFNADLPFDRFVLEQLAADQLELGEDRRALRAVGFLTVGGRFMNNTYDVIDDRIDVVTRGLMGLTVTCARCHDHKFDPVSQQDYYALYGVFASSVEPATQPLFEEPAPTEEYQSFVKELEARQASLEAFLAGKRAALTENAQRRVGDYLLAAHVRRQQPSTEEFMQIADGGDLNPTILSRWQSALEGARRTHHPVLAPWIALETVPEEELGSRVGEVLAGLEASGSAINSLLLRTLREQPPDSRRALASVYAALLNRVEGIWSEQRLRTALEGRAIEALPDPVLEEFRRLFHGLDAPTDISMLPYGDLALLPDRPSQDARKKLQSAVEEWRITGKGAPARAMVLEDLPTPVEPRVFLRGNPNRTGPKVDRRAPLLLTGGEPRSFEHGSGRLELARTIVDSRNPLVARVLVNRLWMHHFGAPLVSTPSDFGLRSEQPIHPELLDWLASELVDEGWSIKRLQRLMVMSTAYRQSVSNPPAEAADADNQLFSRARWRRLDFESLRDSLLTVSDRLAERIGGPSVAKLDDRANNRRTLYASIDRLNLPGIFRTFDFPDPNTTSPKRDPTTVPPQALFLLNHPLVIETARAVAERTEAAEGEQTNEARLESLYQRLFQRVPNDSERAAALAFLAAEPKLEEAWNRLAHALLLTNEFFFLD